MQFPVPQFTDVEDKIVAGLTFKQFAIVFGAGVFTFVIYTISKNLTATIVVGILTGIPALALVFGKLNGRPLYSSAGNFVQFLFGPKVYVYHKEGNERPEQPMVIAADAPLAMKDPLETAVKIKELNYLLQQQKSQESDLIDRIKSNRNSQS